MVPPYREARHHPVQWEEATSLFRECLRGPGGGGGPTASIQATRPVWSYIGRYRLWEVGERVFQVYHIVSFDSRHGPLDPLAITQILNNWQGATQETDSSTCIPRRTDIAMHLLHLWPRPVVIVASADRRVDMAFQRPPQKQYTLPHTTAISNPPTKLQRARLASRLRILSHFNRQYTLSLGSDCN